MFKEWKRNFWRAQLWFAWCILLRMIHMNSWRYDYQYRDRVMANQVPCNVRVLTRLSPALLNHAWLLRDAHSLSHALCGLRKAQSSNSLVLLKFSSRITGSVSSVVNGQTINLHYPKEKVASFLVEVLIVALTCANKAQLYRFFALVAHISNHMSRRQTWISFCQSWKTTPYTSLTQQSLQL